MKSLVFCLLSTLLGEKSISERTKKTPACNFHCVIVLISLLLCASVGTKALTLSSAAPALALIINGTSLVTLDGTGCNHYSLYLNWTATIPYM